MLGLTSGVYENSQNVLTDYFLKMLKAKKNRYYIILCDKKIIGNISLLKKNQTTFELQIVIGEKKYWGKGIGRIAIQRLLKIAFTKLGYKKACLEVRPENSRAIKLYKRCGFSEASIKNSRDKHNFLRMALSKNSWKNLNKYKKEI